MFCFKAVRTILALAGVSAASLFNLSFPAAADVWNTSVIVNLDQLDYLDRFDHLDRPARLQTFDPPPVGSTSRSTGGAVDERELECLAKNIHFESRGEVVEGQHAVAHVTLNRVNHARYPNSVCSVIQESRVVGQRRVCQFGWWCKGLGQRTPSGPEWQRSKQIAYDVLSGRTADPTNGALNFQIKSYQQRLPTHVRARARVIGNHVFFTEL